LAAKSIFSYRSLLKAVTTGILLVLTGLSVVAADKEAPLRPDAGQGRRTVLLLPFKNLVAVYGQSGDIRSPINGRIFLSGPVDNKAAGFMDLKLHTLLAARDTHSLIAAERAADIMTAMDHQFRSKRDLWVATGRVLGADAVLGGFIYRFRDRTGRDYGVDEAASVAFDLHLIRVADSRIQWSGRIDETQQPLSNNLYNIKKFIDRGGKWVTSREMAAGGLKSLVAEMPSR